MKILSFLVLSIFVSQQFLAESAYAHRLSELNQNFQVSEEEYDQAVEQLEDGNQEQEILKTLKKRVAHQMKRMDRQIQKTFDRKLISKLEKMYAQRDLNEEQKSKINEMIEEVSIGNGDGVRFVMIQDLNRSILESLPQIAKEAAKSGGLKKYFRQLRKHEGRAPSSVHVNWGVLGGIGGILLATALVVLGLTFGIGIIVFLSLFVLIGAVGLILVGTSGAVD